MKCSVCGKPATVHLTQILNNKVQKVDLCQGCAQEKGVTDPAGFSLADLLSQEMVGQGAVGSGALLKCEKCGFTQNDFKRLGRFGCPSCYDTFASLLEPILKNMHKGSRHLGKTPQRALARKSYHDQIAELETQLTEAVSSERYEDAAVIRDKISEVKRRYETERAGTST